MDKASFFGLLDILSLNLPSTGEKRSDHLVAPKAATKALRYCAGGDPLDIADYSP